MIINFSMEDNVNQMMTHWKGGNYEIQEFIVVTENKLDEDKLKYEAKVVDDVPSHARGYAPDFGEGFFILVGLRDHTIHWPSFAADVRRDHQEILKGLEALFTPDEKKFLDDRIKSDRAKLMKTIESVVDEHLLKEKA